MPNPILAIILDGVGDRPHPDFDGATPLSAADTPNLDELARRGQTGLIDPLGPGIVPGSGSGHLSLFDLDPFTDAPSRGAIEALGVGIQPDADVYAARGNFVTLDDDGVIRDRRAGRFHADDERKQAQALIEAMNGAAPGGVEFHYHPRMGYRFVVALRGGRFGPGVSDTDPGTVDEAPRTAQATASDRASDLAAETINEAVAAVTSVLDGHAINDERRKADLPPATGFVTRGFGRVVAGPTLEERFGIAGRAVAGGNAYRGLAAYMGLELVDCAGATGDTNADYADKVDTALGTLDDVDLCFLHIKSPDMLGEDGDFAGKRDAIAEIDAAMAPVVERSDLTVGITGDHSTPCTRKAHSGDPVPILFSGPGVRPDDTASYDEFEAMRGGVGRVQGGAYLRTLMDLTNRTKKRE